MPRLPLPGPGPNATAAESWLPARWRNAVHSPPSPFAMPSSSLQKAVSILKRGGVVAFPTETVYGLGARLSDESGIGKIFRIKGRPNDNPLIVHVASLRQAEGLARKIPAAGRRLMRRFWPGPLTLV